MSEAENRLSRNEWVEFFGSVGWKELTRQFEMERDIINQTFRTAKGDDLYVAQGAAEIIDDVLTLKDRVLEHTEEPGEEDSGPD